MSDHTCNPLSTVILLISLYFHLDFFVFLPGIQVLDLSLKLVHPQILYVTLYQLWYAQGYQEQASIESSVTTKVIWSMLHKGKGSLKSKTKPYKCLFCTFCKLNARYSPNISHYADQRSIELFDVLTTNKHYGLHNVE